MVAYPDRGAGNDPEPFFFFFFFFFRGVGSLSQPRLNIFTVGNMRVMICLGQGGLRSLSASSCTYFGSFLLLSNVCSYFYSTHFHTAFFTSILCPILSQTSAKHQYTLLEQKHHFPRSAFHIPIHHAKPSQTATIHGHVLLPSLTNVWFPAGGRCWCIGSRYM